MPPANQNSSNNSNSNKRKRTTTGDDVSTAAKAADGTQSNPAAQALTKWTKAFERSIQNCTDQGISIPPPTSLAFMKTKGSDAVTQFREAHHDLQRAVATEKYATASSTGKHTSAVLGNMKFPPHKTLQGFDVMTDVRVVEALAAAEKDLATAHSSTSTYLTTVYAVQVEKARERVDVAKNADMFAATLTEYCVRIITLAGDPDTAAWQPCVSAVKATLTEQLKGTRFEFTARLDRDATTKEADAQAVLTTR
ncbi:hypothetical protein R3P38DRAFT_3299874 [Favolaschia claudopus]|uniref:Uncharacterized protein n=1 Tax=Favolaschia claudopus TaxID=2862362 RepID=A0AAV9YYY3_9AGAR